MPSWTWKELETLWAYPDWTAEELTERIPRHTAKAIRNKRSEVGRYNRAQVPLCCKCEERPIWDESPRAKRYGLCKGCYLDEERMRLEDEARAVALRQRRRALRRNEKLSEG